MVDKMDPVIKAKWVVALRSDNYVQGTGCLHRLNDEGIHEFCCLGVLCEVLSIPAISPKIGDDSLYRSSKFAYGEYEERNALPREALELTGLKENYPRVTGKLGGENALAGPDTWGLHKFNDTGLTFSEIADLIEEQL